MTDDKRTPKILYVAATARHLRRFHVPYIDALGRDAKIFLMADDGEEMPIDFPIPFQKRMVSLQNLQNIFQIRRILRRYCFDAVILNTTLAAFLVRAAMIGMRRRPYVCNIVHGFLFQIPFRGIRDRIFYICERMMCKKTDSMAVMNAQDLWVAEHYPMSCGGVSFFYGMGARLPKTPPDPDPVLRAKLATKKELLLTFVGELTEAKGQLFLVRACRILRDRGVPVRLLLLGDGMGRERLEKEIASLDMENCVCLPGNCEGVMPYLSVTDIYVSASRKEGLPFNVLEAMSCQLPLLVSDIKGQRDLCADVPGTMFPLDDTEAFCRAIEKRYRGGTYGVGTVKYPSLERYRLSSVLQDTLRFMRKGILSNERTV